MALTAGTHLGNYEIVSVLGVGGMGEVYRARDLRLGREVALKVLPDDVAADANRLARFELEARTVASLNHPNIVTLFSVEDVGDIRFLTMELVAGKSLDQHVVPDGLPVDRVVELGIALAEALTAAHDKGVVHRDFKPANIMLTGDGQVKVLDFGLARLEATESDVDPTEAETVAAPLSGAGQILGTVPYMAPEQVSGEAVDTRTDLFALGIILYELATGRRPFTGATPAVVTTAILRDNPAPLSSVRDDVPSGLDHIISRCLAKDPQARFQTARDVGHELRHLGQTPDFRAVLRQPPVPTTPLLGREDLLAAAAERLNTGARVLTITGYGGTGKTRFAIELFRRLAPEFSEGAAYVSLAAVTAAADVLPAVGLALEIAEAQGRSALEAVGTFIGERRMLLVLDNLEQVLEAATDISTLVSRCPSLQVIATSRAPLKIGAESEFSLPPLALPATRAGSLDDLLACPSVALLVQRAAKVKPGFALTAANADAITAICRRLDGLPLALELAAARVRILEPAALLQRLDHALDLLTSGDRDLPLRQRTLRATISWSYSLLENSEKQVLRAVSAFHEGWTLEAMEQVCYSEAECYRALDDLDSLVEKGLVRVSEDSERYALLETIRAFAAEQLHAGGEVEHIWQSHADYYLEFSAIVAADLRGTGQLAAMRRARQDNANMLAAIRWFTSRAKAGDAAALEKGLLLCGHLNWVWHIGGQHLTGRELLDALLPLVVDAPPSRGRALARLAAGMICGSTGDWERSLAEWIGGHQDGKALGDMEIAAEGMMGAGYTYMSLGRMEEARSALDEAILRSTEAVVPDFLLGVSKTMKSMLLFITGDVDSGIELVTEALQIQEGLHDLEGGGVGRSFLAQMTFAKGDHDRALELYRQALTELATIGDHPEVARVHCEMGWTALAGEDPASAQQSFRSALLAYETVGSPRGTGLALLGLAAVAAAEGRRERAVEIAAAAHALSQRAGVVVEHPMDPAVVSRIDAIKASLPQEELAGLMAKASTLSPREILAMLSAEQ